MRWKLCASDFISVAMRIESMGYNIHGHDIKISLCICGESSDGKPLLDIEFLQKTLSSFLQNINWKPLWEIVGKEGTFEDLLIYIKDNIKIDNICEIKASTYNKEIYLEV